MEMGWILTSIFLFMTFLFVVFAFFLPEWVGITGKKAKSILEEQKNESQTPPKQE